MREDVNPKLTLSTYNPRTHQSKPTADRAVTHRGYRGKKYTAGSRAKEVGKCLLQEATGAGISQSPPEKMSQCFLT